MNVTIVGIVAGIFTSISMFPQLVKILREKKADSISYFMLVILLLGLAGWVWYGILRKDVPIIVTNSFSCLVNMLILIFTIRYKEKT